MLKRGLIILALVATVALPFILRPHRASPAEADDTLILISPHTMRPYAMNSRWVPGLVQGEDRPHGVPRLAQRGRDE